MNRPRGGGMGWGGQGGFMPYGYGGPQQWGGPPGGWGQPGGGWGGPGYCPPGPPWMGQQRMGGPGFGNWNGPGGGGMGPGGPPGEEAGPEPAAPGEENSSAAAAPPGQPANQQQMDTSSASDFTADQNPMGGYGGSGGVMVGGPPPGMWGYPQPHWGTAANSGFNGSAGGNMYPGMNKTPGKKKKNKNKNAGNTSNLQQTETYAEMAAKNLPSKTVAAAETKSEASTSKVSKVEAAKPMSNPEDWPPALKKYVSRCFDQCHSDVDKDQVEIILKGKITSAASSETMWTKDWDNEPLPSTLSSKLSANLGDTSSRGKVFRGGRGGRAGYVTRGGRADVFNNKKSDSKAAADFGSNPNHVPLGTKNKKGKGGKTPHFYKNPMHMDLEGDLGSSAKRMKRAARFAGDSPPPARKKALSLSSLNDKLIKGSSESWEDREGIDWGKMHIVGTCQKLEKPYLRLTEAPEASKVRPVHILKKSLKSVREHWVNKSDYRYACDQLKSIRQDLTVQGVRDSFTVEVKCLISSIHLYKLKNI